MTEIASVVLPPTPTPTPAPTTIKIPLLPRKRGRMPVKTAAATEPKTPPAADVCTIPLKTFHFNPSSELVEFLTEFACVHKYDDRKTFKEAWLKTIAEPDVAPLIEQEIHKLESAGYEGKALDKIFISLKYYYVKKALKASAQPENQGEKKPRKKYECLECDLLTQMDVHIASQIQSHIAPNPNPHMNKDSAFVKICILSPASSYLDFVKIHNETMAEWDDAKIAQVKKTFKNRFFRMKKMLAL